MAILKSRTEPSTCKQTVSNQRIIKKISRREMLSSESFSVWDDSLDRYKQLL